MSKKLNIFNRLIAFTLILTFVFPYLAFANSSNVNSFSIIEDGTEKNILNIKDVKLISWEDKNRMVFEQYDRDNNLVDRVVYNKNTETATSYTEENGVTSIVLSFPKETVGANLRAAANRVDTVLAENTITSTRKNMYVYEKTQSYATDYTLPSKKMTVAKFAAAVAIGLGVSATISNALVGALVSAGLCKIADDLITSTGKKVRANRIEMTYYGQDKQSSKKSNDYQGGRKYVVTSSGSSLNKEYFEGLVYSKAGNKIANILAQNLYGSDFKVY